MGYWQFNNNNNNNNLQELSFLLYFLYCSLISYLADIKLKTKNRDDFNQ